VEIGREIKSSTSERRSETTSATRSASDQYRVPVRVYGFMQASLTPFYLKWHFILKQTYTSYI